MSAAYSLPLHGNPQNGDAYALDDSGYPQDGVGSPGMGWDGQSDGGGKFRLKRRRRCGQCGPCQVKENCNKCQYCLRKDVLKQACVYRKCVYLRKPVARFRQEPVAAASQKSSVPTPPSKPTSTPVPPAPTNSANSASNGSSIITSGGTNSSSSVTPVPNPTLPTSGTAADVAHSGSSELSSCKLNQPPFAALTSMPVINNGVLDPLRHRIIDHSHRTLFDPMNFHPTLDPSRSTVDASKPLLADGRFPSGSNPAGLNPHCKLDQTGSVISYSSDINPAAVAVTSPLNSVNSTLAGHQSYQPSKGSSLPSRESYFPSMDSWSSVPYGLPHASTWASSALPNHHAAAAAAAAAYGFQQHPTPFAPSFTPSCRLGLPDSGAPQFASPAGPQPSFHHSMTGHMASFSQDFSHASSSHASMRAPVNPSFYHSPPHIPPSGISSFHSLGQFPTGQSSFGPAAYSMHPHSHMYPSGFYSFRAATEPQIYHVEVYPSQNPFKHTLRELSFLFPWEKDAECKTVKFHEDIAKSIQPDISERLHQHLTLSDVFTGVETCAEVKITFDQKQTWISSIPNQTITSVKDKHHDSSSCGHSGSLTAETEQRATSSAVLNLLHLSQKVTSSMSKSVTTTVLRNVTSSKLKSVTSPVLKNVSTSVLRNVTSAMPQNVSSPTPQNIKSPVSHNVTCILSCSCGCTDDIQRLKLVTDHFNNSSTHLLTSFYGRVDVRLSTPSTAVVDNRSIGCIPRSKIMTRGRHLCTLWSVEVKHGHERNMDSVFCSPTEQSGNISANFCSHLGLCVLSPSSSLLSCVLDAAMSYAEINIFFALLLPASLAHSPLACLGMGGYRCLSFRRRRALYRVNTCSLMVCLVFYVRIREQLVIKSSRTM